MGKTEAFEAARFAAYVAYVAYVNRSLSSPADDAERAEAIGWFRLGVQAEIAARSIAASRLIGQAALGAA